jgi:hypothetical protein
MTCNAVQRKQVRWTADSVLPACQPHLRSSRTAWGWLGQAARPSSLSRSGCSAVGLPARARTASLPSRSAATLFLSSAVLADLPHRGGRLGTPAQVGGREGLWAATTVYDRLPGAHRSMSTAIPLHQPARAGELFSACWSMQAITSRSTCRRRSPQPSAARRQSSPQALAAAQAAASRDDGSRNCERPLPGGSRRPCWSPHLFVAQRRAPLPKRSNDGEVAQRAGGVEQPTSHAGRQAGARHFSKDQLQSLPRDQQRPTRRGREAGSNERPPPAAPTGAQRQGVCCCTPAAPHAPPAW